MPAIPADIPRRAVLSGGPLALAGALAACGATPERAAGPVLGRRPDPQLARLEGDAPELAVAGRRLNLRLLRRFYARHRFAPVWAEREAQADSLAEAVLRAGEHGLAPELFHAALLRRRQELTPLDRELLLSDAVLSYADALAHGAVPVGRRGPGQELAPEPVDVAAALDAALGGPQPAAQIEALAPGTPAYAALRRALRRHRAEGGADPAGAGRLRALEVNLERQRWLPRPMPPERVWVNVADQSLTLYRANRPVFVARVVVGSEAERNQSPEFRALIEGSFFNPPWIVPRDIVEARFLPRMREDPDFLAKHNMVLRENGELEQRPGPDAALGVMMLDMPNRFDVYVHDTPGRHAFARDDRRLSHGCIRVENPRVLAALLFEQPVEAIDRAIATGETTRAALPRPVPVFVAYQTAFADPLGEAQFRPDFYGRDARIWQQIQGREPTASRPAPPAASVAAALPQEGAPGPRRPEAAAPVRPAPAAAPRSRGAPAGAPPSGAQRASRPASAAAPARPPPRRPAPGRPALR